MNKKDDSYRSLGVDMKKVESLQAFRAIAFLFVFLSHTELCPTGGVGVSMFLVLSGFLMAFSNYRKPMMEPVTVRSSAHFAIQKISKLYLLHMITLAMMLAYTVLLLWKDGFPITAVRETLIALPLNALLLQTWVPNEAFYFTFNKVSWYLSVCLFIYFVFPYIFHKLRVCSTDRLVLIGGMIIALQVAVAVPASLLLPEQMKTRMIKWIVYICPIFRSGDFFLGNILGLYCLKNNIQNEEPDAAGWKYTALEMLCVAVCAVLCILRAKDWIPMWLAYGIVWLPASLLGVYLFYKKRGFVTKMLSNKLLVYIGNISAYAFLIHQMTIHIVKFAIRDVWLLSLVSLVATILLSCIYGKFEEGFLALGKRLIGKRNS